MTSRIVKKTGKHTRPRGFVALNEVDRFVLVKDRGAARADAHTHTCIPIPMHTHRSTSPSSRCAYNGSLSLAQASSLPRLRVIGSSAVIPHRIARGGCRRYAPCAQTWRCSPRQS